MSADELQNLLYRESGLLGISGISSDLRDLLKSNQPDAKLAADYFVIETAKAIASLASSLGGLDGLIFSGGIGEHQPAIRSAVVEALAWMGVQLDTKANDSNMRCISTDDRKVCVLVVAADEEQILFEHAGNWLQQHSPSSQ